MPRILLTSIGRRTYLAEYFEAAFGRSGLVVADADAAAPGMHLGYESVELPRLEDDSYVDALNSLIDSFGITMIASLHDREVAQLARLRPHIRPEATVLGMPTENWDIGLDKYRTHRFLDNAGVPVPASVASLEEADRCLARGDLALPLVIKPRYGSASIGVRIVREHQELQESLDGPQAYPHEVLIQQWLEGDEYGLDVVSDLSGRYLGALGRRKLRMSGGETDDAVTVDSAPFDPLAREIAALTRHSGLIDVDVIETLDGRFCVIDVNPRFGGGYPFSHVAGADVPKLLRSLIGGEAAPSALRAAPGIRSRKTIALIVVNRRPVNR